MTDLNYGERRRLGDQEDIDIISLDILKEWKRRNPQIKNVMIFVSDSLRWDYLPESIANRGIRFKTIASAPFTAGSFPSIVSGLYPNHHGVHSFFDTLSKWTPTFLNIKNYNTSFWTENVWIDYEPKGSSQIHRILRCKTPIPLEELKTPFVYFEDEKGGHCPYGWTENDVYKEIECRKFFSDYGKKPHSELLKRYKMGIDRSVEEFEKRVRILEKRDLLDSTLIIFLSDHGELLGEYGGLVGHGIPTTPEIAYVPTVFIHPDLPKNITFEEQGVLRHVDLFPTILGLLNINNEKNVDGVNLFESNKMPDFGCNYMRKQVIEEGFLKKILDVELKEKSVWDKNGGYLFREGTNFVLRLILVIYLTTLSRGIHSSYLRGRLQKTPFKMIKNYFTIWRNYSASSIQYGNPHFDKKKSEELIGILKEKQIENKEISKIKSTINKLKSDGKI